ncbi:MAG: c-type cytochrome [Gammaproteobacteria bacterium]|nr:c-type cytochrome [Gammaproteobacteria bacterium]
MQLIFFTTSLRTLPAFYIKWFVGLSFFLLTICAQAETTSVASGLKLVQQFACQSCHTIGDQGGIVGPNLNQVTIRRDKQWLMDWLKDPATIKQGTLMPKFDWKPGDREAVIDYLASFATQVDGDAIIAQKGKDENAGKALIQAYQCAACHKVAGEPGRMLFPDLTTVKERRTPEWERNWLKDPQAIKPGTFMPNFHLSDDEIQAITSYLYR